MRKKTNTVKDYVLNYLIINYYNYCLYNYANIKEPENCNYVIILL